MFLWLICILWMLERLQASAWLALAAIFGYLWYLLVVRGRKY